jgi:protein TonB
VPKERVAKEIPPPPRTVESRSVPDEQAKAEAEIPSPPASTEEQPSTLFASPSLVAKPNSEVKEAYAKEAVPLYLKNPPPEYPSVARRRGYEGTVVLEVFVDREGRVLDLSLFQSSGHNVLDRAAMQAVRGWLFEPARRGEETVDMWVKVPLTFRLK